MLFLIQIYEYNRPLPTFFFFYNFENLYTVDFCVFVIIIFVHVLYAVTFRTTRIRQFVRVQC